MLKIRIQRWCQPLTDTHEVVPSGRIHHASGISDSWVLLDTNHRRERVPTFEGGRTVKPFLGLLANDGPFLR